MMINKMHSRKDGELPRAINSKFVRNFLPTRQSPKEKH